MGLKVKVYCFCFLAYFVVNLLLGGWMVSFFYVVLWGYGVGDGRAFYEYSLGYFFQIYRLFLFLLFYLVSVRWLNFFGRMRICFFLQGNLDDSGYLLFFRQFLGIIIKLGKRVLIVFFFFNVIKLYQRYFGEKIV